MSFEAQASKSKQTRADQVISVFFKTKVKTRFEIVKDSDKTQF